MQQASWWQYAVIYEVYPRSFQDSNGDGIGDLNGIMQRLDYLVELKIDAVWISPIYPSPMADFGYDVADSCSIDPICMGNDAIRLSLPSARRRSHYQVLLRNGECTRWCHCWAFQRHLYQAPQLPGVGYPEAWQRMARKHRHLRNHD